MRQRAGHIRIEVVDSGVGIPSDQHRAIFTEFTRLGAVEAEGLGLGLATVERIARLLELDISITSQVGRGSRFCVTLAASAETALPVAAPVVRGLSHAHRRVLTVLVVDNDATIIEASTALFSGHGHRVLGARTMAEALAQADQADVALIDHDLDDGENGLLLIDRIRRRAPRVTLAMISATQDRTLLTALRIRGVPFFAKPVDPDRLADFLAEASKREVEAQ